MTDVAARFRLYVGATGDGCWPWTGGISSDGYGVFWNAGRSVRAHRMAWEIAHGPVPPGMLVCHACDNPPCCNPAHLFVGTNGDNQRDARDKGRLSPHLPVPPTGERWYATHTATLPRGERVGTAKLTEHDVRAIRARCASGEPRKSVAAAYGVRHTTVHKVVHGESWRHVV